MRVPVRVVVALSLLPLAAGFALLHPAAAAATPTVVALWHMDEPAGATTMVDSSGSNNNGSLTNVETGVAGPPAGPCQADFGLCYRFAGAGLPSVAVVPHSDTMNPGANDVTLSEWVNTGVIPPPSVGDYDMIRKGLSTTPGGDYKMEVLPKRQGTVAKASCHFRGSVAKATLTKGPNLADNQWHHIQCTKKATSIELRVDANLYTKTVTIGSISNTADVTVGAKSPTGGDQYTGLMDEVSISIG